MILTPTNMHITDNQTEIIMSYSISITLYQPNTINSC